METRKGNLLINILTEKCPHCGEGKVFEKTNGALKIPEMKKECDVCHYKFDREPDYFLGAMYVSYGLAVFQALVTFLICYFGFPQLPLLWVCISITVVVALFSIKNFKLSRVIYIHIFPW